MYKHMSLYSMHQVIYVSLFLEISERGKGEQGECYPTTQGSEVLRIKKQSK